MKHGLCNQCCHQGPVAGQNGKKTSKIYINKQNVVLQQIVAAIRNGIQSTPTVRYWPRLHETGRMFIRMKIRPDCYVYTVPLKNSFT